MLSKSLAKHVKIVLFTLVVGSLILVACAGGEKPDESKVMKFIFTQEFDTLNPLYTNMWFSQITQDLWSCWAWKFDDKNAPVPNLVTEMPSVANGGISADGRVITLKLRDDLEWSDGKPLTSDDFVFTYEQYINPKNAVASTSPYDLMEKVEAPDKQTVIVTFKEPYAAWMGQLFKGVIPAHILRPVVDKDGTLDNAEWSRNPTVGCGPYVFSKWESGSFAEFVANKNYWGTIPKIGKINIRFVPDDASQIAALKAGDGDLGTFIAYPDVPDLQAAGVDIVKAYSGYNEVWYFMMDPEKGHPALQDEKVRQAIAMAFDRFSLNKDLLLGLTQPAIGYYDNTPYIDPSLQPYPFDPEKAKALLDEAGWKDTNGDGVRDKDGVELVLKYGTTTREVRKDTQAVAQQQLADVGIKTELLNFDSDIYFAGYAEDGPAAKGELDIFEYSTTTSAWPDPDVVEWLCDQIPTDEAPDGTNWTRLCDPELEGLFRQQAQEMDFQKRVQVLQQISKYIRDKAYMIGIWQDPDLWAVRNTLSNVKIGGSTPFFNIAEWDMPASTQQ